MPLVAVHVQNWFKIIITFTSTFCSNLWRTLSWNKSMCVVAPDGRVRMHQAISSHNTDLCHWLELYDFFLYICLSIGLYWFKWWLDTILVVRHSALPMFNVHAYLCLAEQLGNTWYCGTSLFIMYPSQYHLLILWISLFHRCLICLFFYWMFFVTFALFTRSLT